METRYRFTQQASRTVLRQPIANSQPLKLVKVEDSQHSSSFANDEPLLGSDNDENKSTASSSHLSAEQESDEESTNQFCNCCGYDGNWNDLFECESCKDWMCLELLEIRRSYNKFLKSI